MNLIYAFIFGVVLLGGNCDLARKVSYDALKPYISDGQYRKAELNPGSSQKFSTTFYGGRNYKISTSLDGEKGKVRWKLMNSFGKVLFDSQKVNNPASWNLQFKSTSFFQIEVSLPENAKEGCAVMLIGFDNK